MDRTHRLAGSAVALALAACQTADLAAAEAGQRRLEGSWGGSHVALVLGPDGGALEYDCASGSIDGPLRVDADGRFAAQGFHIPGQGGPVRQGDEPRRLPAQYSGEVRGGTMILRVRVPSAGIEIGPLTLRRGAEPAIFRCL